MLVLLITVAHQLQRQPDWKQSLQKMFSVSGLAQNWKLPGMFALMIVNWGIESFKWKIALQPIQQISYGRAFKAILAGTCVASFTPNRIGEYMGRMLFVEPGNKMVSIAPTVLCSMAQMLITLAAGSVGIYYYSGLQNTMQTGWLSPAFFRSVIIITTSALLFLSLIYFRFDPLIKRLNGWFKKRKKNFILPGQFPLSTRVSILFLSVIRYMVFITQYYLLFSLFGIPLMAKQVFTGVSTMFVVMAAVPTLTFLTDLGFRWAAGIQVFQVYTSNTAGILAVSLAIWLINLIIPALVGSLLILRIKFFRSQ